MAFRQEGSVGQVPNAIPSGTAFKMVFVAAKKKGWHKTRLVDATGEPINEENFPEDNF